MAVFSLNLGGILNDDVILGQIFGRDGGSGEISKIFGWRVSQVGLNRVLEGTPATRPTLVEFGGDHLLLTTIGVGSGGAQIRFGQVGWVISYVGHPYI